MGKSQSKVEFDKKCMEQSLEAQLKVIEDERKMLEEDKKRKAANFAESQRLMVEIKKQKLWLEHMVKELDAQVCAEELKTHARDCIEHQLDELNWCEAQLTILEGTYDGPKTPKEH